MRKQIYINVLQSWHMGGTTRLVVIITGYMGRSYKKVYIRVKIVVMDETVRENMQCEKNSYL